MKQQPAIKSYYFGKGYTELWGTIKKSWQYNLQNAKDNFQKAKDCSPFSMRISFSSNIENVKKLFYYVTGVSVLLFGGLWYLIFSGLHIAILGSFFLSIYIGCGIVWGLDRLYRWRNKIYQACPDYHKTDMPIYYCPTCRVEHNQLRPGAYGVMKRTCECGTQIPTSFLNGREELDKVCPVDSCKKPIGGDRFVPKVFLLLGAPSTGKSCFNVASTQAIKNDSRWKFSFNNSITEKEYGLVERNFNSGKYPAKTDDALPKFFEFFLEKEGFNEQRKIHILDPSGELFGSGEIHKLPFNYFDGAVLFIDPFAIPSVRQKYKVNSNDSRINPAQVDAADLFDRILISLEKNFAKFKKGQKKNRLVIAINKVDNFDLEDKIGKSAAQKLQADKGLKSLNAAYNELCEEFLLENDMGSLVQGVRLSFPNYQYFPVSTTKGIRIEQPFKWLMEKVDAKFMK